MKVVIDTNVFVSGIFFTGPPYQILEAWRKGKIQLVLSPEILEEYQRVGEELTNQFKVVDLNPTLDLLTAKGLLINAVCLNKQVCDDPDDDKFISCAIAGKVKLIVSGDKHLLRASGYSNIDIVKPRQFVDDYLSK